RAKDILHKVAQLLHDVRDGFPLLHTTLLDEVEVDQYKQQLTQLRNFLQSLQVYNTPAKLKNFKYALEEVKSYGDRLQVVSRLEKLKLRVDELSKHTHYLETAQHHLPVNHPWRTKTEAALIALIHALKQGEEGQQEQHTLQEL